MKEIKKSKKGFTLVEVLLSLAIIMMIGGVIAGLCASIGSSFATTYNINDSADYAMLFGKGFENSFLSITQRPGVATQTWTWYMSKPGESGSTVTVPTLMVKDSKGSDTPVFHPQFLNKAGTNETKWDIYTFYKKTETVNSETGEKAIVILYRIFVVDKENKNFAYRYDGKLWVPRFEERATMSGIKGREIKVLTTTDDGKSLPMTPSTFASLSGTKAYDMIADSLESEGAATYYSRIQYKWSN